MLQIIGYHLDRDSRTIFTSNNERCSEPPYIEFLLKEQDAIRVCYQLDFFVANLLKFINLSDKQLIQIHDTSELSTNGYKFKFVPKKFFSIIKGDKFVVLSDASQYMERYDLLEDPLKKAKEAQIIGVQVYNALSRLGLHPNSLVSPISAFDKEIFSKLNLPQIEDIPEEASEYAYNCCKGNWVESYQKGHFDKVYDLDISSAYPSIISKDCIDVRLGTWIKTDKFEQDAYYGFCKGIVNITSDFSPIIYSSDDNQSSTPKGEWETYITKQEIEFIEKYKLGTFEIEDGWWFFPDKITYPLKKITEWLYAKKESSKGIQKKIIKRIMSGLYGRTLQVDFGGVIGDYFMPVWGATIQVNTRLEVARFILDNNLTNHVLSIAVDGCLVTKEVKIEL